MSEKRRAALLLSKVPVGIPVKYGQIYRRNALQLHFEHCHTGRHNQYAGMAYHLT